MTPSPSLAARLLAQGRVALARSFRLHRPRGAFCHRGWCQQCKVKLTDGRVVLACQSTESHAALHRWDALRIVGRMAEGAVPWAWERHVFADGALQRTYLETLRRLSGALPLADNVVNTPRAATQRYDTDVLIVGAGVAGRAAAEALQARSVACLVVDPLPASGNSDASRAASDPKQYLCVGLYEQPRRALCVGSRDNAIVHFQRLVVATGAYDRIPTVPGNDVPGIIGLRGFEILARDAALPPAVRIGFFGHRLEAQRALAAASQAGVSLRFIAGPADLPDFGGSVFPNSPLLRVLGRSRVRGIELERVGALDCDLLIVGISQPSYELQAQNGCTIELRGSPPIVRATSSGSAPWIAVGEAAGDYVEDGTPARVREIVNAWLSDEPIASNHAAAPLGTAEAHDDAFVCLCEDVRVRDIRTAIAEGYRDVELVKRHTGAGTGPCQGKLCHGALLACAHSAGLDVRIPTPRPLVRPVRVAALAGSCQFPSNAPQ